jgi:hypothetical protein
MGSLALLPVGFLLAGPLASLLGAQTVLGVGGGIGVVATLVTLLPRSTRRLTNVPDADSAELLARYPATPAPRSADAQPSSSRAR